MAKDQSKAAEELKLSKEELRLDKFKTALSNLKEQVGNLSEFAAIEEQLRAAFMKDVREELELSEEESNALWEQAKKTLTTNDKWKDILKEKIDASDEKMDVNDYVSDVENYDAIKAAIERKGGEGMIKQFIGFLKEKWDNSKWAKKYGITSAAIFTWFGKMFVEYAEAGKKKLDAEKAKGFVFSSAWRSPFYGKLKSIGEWLSGEEKKEEKPKEEAKKGAETKKYEKDIKELQGAFKFHGIEYAFTNADYERVLKKFNNDPKKLKDLADKALAPKGSIGIIYTQIERHKNKKLKNDFKFKLDDLLIPPRKLEHVAKAIEGNDDTYEIPKLAQLTPKGLRRFLDAVRIGEADEPGNVYEKSPK